MRKLAIIIGVIALIFTGLWLLKPTPVIKPILPSVETELIHHQRQTSNQSLDR